MDSHIQKPLENKQKWNLSISKSIGKTSKSRFAVSKIIGKISNSGRSRLASRLGTSVWRPVSLAPTSLPTTRRSDTDVFSKISKTTETSTKVESQWKKQAKVDSQSPKTLGKSGVSVPKTVGKLRKVESLCVKKPFENEAKVDGEFQLLLIFQQFLRLRIHFFLFSTVF